jgi:3-oxoacyl-[acyl-carrier protein] reductase
MTPGKDATALPLAGRVAIVTGSARNIGRATALALARLGAAVMLHARRDSSGLDEATAVLAAEGMGVASHLADLATEAGAERLVAATVERLGRVDILINNAAIRRNTPFTSISLAEWREVLGASLDAAFLTSRAAVPYMRGGKWGRIINVGGITMFKGTPGRAHVAASKAAMMGMTRVLASELASDGITVNMVSPGIIDTVRGTAAGARPEATRTLAAIPLGREGTPDEIAHIIAMLCHPQGGYSTGQVLEINGGMHYS